jgi:two-component system cell cycle sensor histidine kinase/response regulator CckA
VDAIVGKTASEATGTFVRMTVTDSGVGISPEVHEHLFERFFTTKAHGKGTGLGLALVYGIVKDVGGEIVVRTTEGAGASFEIFMPRVEERISQAVSGKAKPSGVSSAPKTILLVDDQEDIRGLIRQFLERAGFKVIEAENGQQALELAEAYDGYIDVLLTDVLMPKMDGVTLSWRLSAKRPDMKILFISGQPGNQIDALKDAALTSAFMPKPFSLQSLLHKIRELAA